MQHALAVERFLRLCLVALDRPHVVRAALEQRLHQLLRLPLDLDDLHTQANTHTHKHKHTNKQTNKRTHAHTCDFILNAVVVGRRFSSPASGGGKNSLTSLCFVPCTTRVINHTRHHAPHTSSAAAAAVAVAASVTCRCATTSMLIVSLLRSQKFLAVYLQHTLSRDAHQRFERGGRT